MGCIGEESKKATASGCFTTLKGAGAFIFKWPARHLVDNIHILAASIRKDIESCWVEWSVLHCKLK